MDVLTYKLVTQHQVVTTAVVVVIMCFYTVLTE